MTAHRVVCQECGFGGGTLRKDPDGAYHHVDTRLCNEGRRLEAEARRKASIAAQLVVPVPRIIIPHLTLPEHRLRGRN